jgi:tRNA (guanine37-N1)-methyltransferase
LATSFSPGGEVAAQALLEACIRLLPGVAGNAESLTEESFETGLLEHPHYTRPQTWENREIPAVLTSGDHAKVAAWRRNQAEELTKAADPIYTPLPATPPFQGRSRATERQSR